jgi:hypothetical protein
MHMIHGATKAGEKFRALRRQGGELHTRTCSWRLSQEGVYTLQGTGPNPTILLRQGTGSRRPRDGRPTGQRWRGPRQRARSPLAAP